MKKIICKFCLFLWPREMTYLEKVVAYIALIGILIAVNELREVHNIADFNKKQLKEIENISEENKEQIKEINVIQGSMTTRSIGKFPDVMLIINDYIKKADHSIVIICGRVSQSCFTDPKICFEYRKAICDKISQNNNLTVKIYSGNDSVREELYKSQFNFNNENYCDNEYFNKHFKISTNLANDSIKRDSVLRKYCLYNGLSYNEIKNGKDLFESLEKVENNFVNEIMTQINYSNPKIQKIIPNSTGNSPFYFWMIDDHIVIYSFYHFGNVPEIETFYTEMPSMVEFVRAYINNLDKYSKKL